MSEWLNPQAVANFIQTVGFSVAVALWFMFRAEKRFDENNRLQTEQIKLLEKLLGERKN